MAPLSHVPPPADAMAQHAYLQRRREIETYFDRTAADAWARLTSDAPVGRIRATVRAGRERMRRLLLDALPADLGGRRILDAGCGTGALAIELARRGATVVAIDLSPTLVALARSRLPEVGPGRVLLMAGDMTDPSLGPFDHVVAMDSLIHYGRDDMRRVLDGYARRTSGSLLFTFAPRTPALAAMHAVGRLFPRADRAPSIEPVSPAWVERALVGPEALAGWRIARSERVASGFYTSQAVVLEPDAGGPSR